MSTHSTVYSGATKKMYRMHSAYNAGTVALVGSLVPVLALAPILVIANALKHTGTVSGGAIALSVAVVVIAVIGVWSARHYANGTYLVLSSAGLEYYGRGITIKTPWNNVKELMGGSMPQLLLHRGAATYISPMIRRDLYTDRRIPLYLFAYLPQSELARDLRAFAPQLSGNRTE